jgi:acetolactate synthase-1/2/3 large subunit
VTGNEVLAQTLTGLGVRDFFYIMGGPMGDVERMLIDAGVRGVDVRHEQAAAMMAHAYTRVSGRVGVAMGCSGPGALNLLTGVATAWADGCPVVAIGGSSPTFQAGMGTFQEVDQVAAFRPVTKWSTRITDPARISDTVQEAFQRARGGRPGPVYLDLPADVLFASLPDPQEGRAEEKRTFELSRTVSISPNTLTHSRPSADPEDVRRAVRILAAAERPIILAGTGIFWSEAWNELRELVDLTGIPFYTTPQGRGVIEEDHPLALIAARSTAFRKADAVLIAGTRLNHMIGFGRPPRFAPDATFLQIDIAAEEIGHNRPVEVGLVGDAKAVLRQLADEARSAFAGRATSPWVSYLNEVHARKSAEHEALISTDQRPIHPLRLAKEVRDVIGRDTILAVDGHEILSFCRQTIPSYEPGHRLNSGPFGTMGVGVPFGIGAKVARPDAPVLVVQGDGSFGMNGMEMDTAVRHDIPIVCVIGNNAGWTSERPGPVRVGTRLGHTRYERMGEALGAHAEFVEEPSEIRPALERAIASGRPAVVNVLTDPTARAETARYSVHESV